jgi:hypothetical protein
MLISGSAPNSKRIPGDFTAGGDSWLINRIPTTFAFEVGREPRKHWKIQMILNQDQLIVRDSCGK